MNLFYITESRPLRVLKTVHRPLCPATRPHSQSFFPAGKLFQDSPPAPSLHTSYSPCDAARAQRHISLSFPDPRSRCLHRSLAATHPYVDTSQISLQGLCCVRQQT